MEFIFGGLPLLIIMAAVIGSARRKDKGQDQNFESSDDFTRYNTNGVPMVGNSGMDVLGNPLGSTEHH